jgi:hypothetical protein
MMFLFGLLLGFVFALIAYNVGYDRGANGKKRFPWSKVPGTLVVVGLLLIVPVIGATATIDFTKIASYSDNSAIPAAKLLQIIYTPYWGPSNAGTNPALWPNKGAGVADVSTLPAPDPSPSTMPPPGQSVNVTWYYTVTATLDGLESIAGSYGTKTVTVTSPLIPPKSPTGVSVR